jgi:hypothetical protein
MKINQRIALVPERLCGNFYDFSIGKDESIHLTTARGFAPMCDSIR